jgi:lipopolysaccharide transport system ATP-binding protein
MIGRSITRARPGGLQLGICGTFDVANYGDLIFPLIAEAELSRRLGALTLHRFSYHDKRPPDWPYSVSSLSALPEVAGGLEGLIIGGGHLIRFDKEVAPGYAPPVAGIHHPTGYWLTPALIALQHGLPVVWNAPGVHGPVPAWAHPLMDIALRHSRYVAVRDIASRRAIERFTAGAEVAVVPDTAFHIDRLIDVDRPSPEFLHQRRARGLAGPYLVVQAAAPLRDFVRWFRRHRLSQTYRLVALPIGPVNGDTNTVFDDGGGDVIRLDMWPAPLVIAELIANASAVIGVSLHLSITALVFGVPVFRSTALANAKYDVLSSFGAVHDFDTVDDLGAVSFARRLGRGEPLAAVRAAQNEVTAHWDRISRVFDDAIDLGAGAGTRAALGAFWQALPGFLEVSARPDRPAMETRGRHVRWNYFGRRED